MKTHFRVVRVAGQAIQISPAQERAILVLRQAGRPVSLALHVGGYVRGRLAKKGLAVGRGIHWELTKLGKLVVDLLRPPMVPWTVR